MAELNPEAPEPEALEPEEEQTPITAWHHLLVQTMERLIGPEQLTILSFFRLGELPIEADIIALLRQVPGAELARRVPEFDFLLGRMAELTIIEYKGPEDRLTLAGFTTALAYAFLARRKLKDGKRLRPLRQMCLQILYSYKEKGLLDTLEADGLPFRQEEPGILRCDTLRMPIYLIDLVALADRDPARLISLLSARRLKYRQQQAERLDAAAKNLYYSVFEELRRMLSDEKLKNLPGARQVIDDVDQVWRRIASRMKPEDLRDVPVDVRLAGVSAEERLRGLGAEERLRGLGAEERLRGLGAEELRGLSPENRARLLALLLTDDE